MPLQIFKTRRQPELTLPAQAVAHLHLSANCCPDAWDVEVSVGPEVAGPAQALPMQKFSTMVTAFAQRHQVKTKEELSALLLKVVENSEARLGAIADITAEAVASVMPSIYNQSDFASAELPGEARTVMETLTKQKGKNKEHTMGKLTVEQYPEWAQAYAKAHIEKAKKAAGIPF